MAWHACCKHSDQIIYLFQNSALNIQCPGPSQTVTQYCSFTRRVNVPLVGHKKKICSLGFCGSDSYVPLLQHRLDLLVVIQHCKKQKEETYKDWAFSSKYFGLAWLVRWYQGCRVCQYRVIEETYSIFLLTRSHIFYQSKPKLSCRTQCLEVLG